jgi:hypothetical protein
MMAIFFSRPLTLTINSFDIRKFLTPDATLRRVLRAAQGRRPWCGNGAGDLGECARCNCLVSGAGVRYLATEAATPPGRRARVEDEMSLDSEADGGMRAQHKRLFCDGRTKAHLALPRQSVPGIRVRHFRPCGKAI